MRKSLLSLLISLSTFTIYAQTWTGAISTAWNTAGNWTPATVPTAASAVIIPSTVNKPVLQSHVTITSLSMALGSALDFNGFNITTSAAFDINGATLNNSNGATDIVITMNGNSGSRYFRQNIVNDHIIFNINSNSEGFYEAFQNPNTFNGNTTFNIAGSAIFHNCYDRSSTYNGSVTINRTVAGTTGIFTVGATTVNGNFTYTNNAGGVSDIHSTGTNLVPITGAINITAAGTGNPNFSMRYIRNQTTGGTISVQNSGQVNIANDTLMVNALNINGFTGNLGDDFLQNSITGNINISDAATNTNYIYFRGNTIQGSSTFTLNGSGIFYEGYLYPCVFNGPSIFNIAGIGGFFTSYQVPSTFNGNVAINRTVAGPTNIFETGANAVNGNFSYTNNAGGATIIHAAGLPLVPITGTINITATGTGNPPFFMRRVQNQTNGGTISVQNSGQVTIINDTIMVSAMNITAFTGNLADDISQNSITGNVEISDVAGNGNNYFFRGNTVNGNSIISLNSAAPFFEGHTIANVFNGNTSFNITGSGVFYTCYDRSSTFNGNVTIARTAAGSTFIFNNGATGVNGNFAYTNSAGGLSNIYNNGSLLLPVSGTINILANGAGNPVFTMRRIQNQTTGGTISVQNSGQVIFANDTLKVAAFNVNDFTGTLADDFLQNEITGSVNISEAAANSNFTYFRGNTVNGNSVFGLNATSQFYEGHTNPNIFNGHSTFNIAGTGTFYTCYDRASTFNGDVSITRTAAGSTFIFNNGATAVNGNFSYTNDAGGLTNINAGGTTLVPVTGTINISANGGGNPPFSMRRLQNQTTGGTISVQNSGLVTFANDTLMVGNFNVNGFTGTLLDDFSQNSITGNVDISDAASNSNSIYFRGNTINGNTLITTNASINFYDSYQFSNTYNGNLDIVRNAGTFNFAYDRPTSLNQNFTINSATGFNFTDTVKFRGSLQSQVEQLGTQPIIIPRLAMQKTGEGKVILNDSVTISTVLFFDGGHIYSSAGKELVFASGSLHNGVSANSHVVGPVAKIGATAFTFPIGSPVSLNTVAMSAPVGATSRFSAEYIMQNPTIDGYNTSLKAGSFGATQISNAGYWDVRRITGATNVSLTLGFQSNPYQQYPVLANLKVAHWNGSQWDDHGNGGTTGSSASGTVINSVAITSFSPFAIAGITPTYFFNAATPGPGPDGTPIKIKGKGGWPAYSAKILPAGSYTTDSIFLVANGSTTLFRLRDMYGVEKDTSITVTASPANYISANGNGTINFAGWRHFVYLRDANGNMMGAIRDNNHTMGNTMMHTYFSTPAVATAPNGNVFLKRSFRITSQSAPAGTVRVRLYISKTEFNNLVAADPASFPNGINSLTITKYTGPAEDSLFNPIPGGNAFIIPNSSITIADLGVMYSLDIDVNNFSGFYIGGNMSALNICSGSTVSLPSNISGASYQWQVNNGSGYVNVVNSGTYSGANTSTLTITNAPGNLYGNQYRALVNGVTLSQVYTLKFSALWQGTVSSAWENTANWSCGVLPDANTDVVLKTGKPFYPQINASTSVRTLTANSGTTVTVKTGATLTILK